MLPFVAYKALTTTTTTTNNNKYSALKLFDKIYLLLCNL